MGGSTQEGNLIDRPAAGRTIPRVGKPTTARLDGLSAAVLSATVAQGEASWHGV